MNYYFIVVQDSRQQTSILLLLSFDNEAHNKQLKHRKACIVRLWSTV